MSAKKNQHFYNCPVKMGKGYASPEFAFVFWALGMTAFTFWKGEVLLTLLFAGVTIFTSGWILFTVPENTFAVLARLDKILPGVLLDGLHKKVPGDESHIIARNPINVEVPFKRRMLDGPVVSGKVRATVRPDPRIGDKLLRNRYATWVVQERHEGRKGLAEHNVREAIEAPIKFLFLNLPGQINSTDLDQWLYGLALLVESELGCHTPLHRDPEFRLKVAGLSAGDPVPPEKEGPELIKWYSDNHRMVAHRLHELDQEFEDNPTKPLALESVSHVEAHTSSTLEEVAIVDLEYDAITTKAGQDNLAAKLVEATHLRIVQNLRKEQVDPVTAATIAAGMVGRADVKGNVIAGSQTAVNVVDNRGGG